MDHANEIEKLTQKINEQVKLLNQSEKRFRLIITNNVDPILVVDKSGFIRFLNPAAEKLFGRSNLALSGREFGFPIVAGESVELEIRRPNGSLAIAEMRVAILEWEGEEAYITSLRDITERKQTESALRLYEQALANADSGIVIADAKQADLPIIYVNQAFERITGYTSEEAIGQNCRFLQGQDRQQPALQPLREALNLGQSFHGELKNYRKNGEIFWNDLTLTPVYDETGQVTHYLGIQNDITERKAFEQQLQQQNQELRLLNKVITASITNMEIEAMLTEICQELAETLTLPYVTALLMNEEKNQLAVVGEYKTDDTLPNLQNKILPLDSTFAQAMKSPHYAINIQPETFDQHTWLTSLAIELAEFNIAPKLLLFLAIGNDILGAFSLSTAPDRTFTQAEIELVYRVAKQISESVDRANLIHNRRRLITALEQVGEGVIITDEAARVLYANPAFTQMSQYTLDDIVGSPISILNSTQHDDEFFTELWQTITAGKIWRGRFVNRRKDGTYYTTEATISPVFGPTGNIVNYVSVQRDVSRELKLEEQLRHAQKMEAIGTLAGGVAHEFNNILTTIIGFSDLLLKRPNLGHLVTEDVEAIQKAAQRAAILTRQLLAFARRQAVLAQIVNLNHLLKNVEPTIHQLLQPNIELTFSLSSDLWLVRIDPNQFENVLSGLIANAQEAMPTGGQLSLATQNILLDDSLLAAHPGIPAGRYVCLTVSDSGQGMTESVKNQIFDPFFTTKEVGQGVGLGLSMCFGIVKQNQGFIEVDSQLGHGTEFRIYLPFVDHSPQPLPRPAPPPAAAEDFPPMLNKHTILLVEQEPDVRALTKRVLHNANYIVTDVASPDEAKTRLQDPTAAPFQLLILNLVQPNSSNINLLDYLTEHHPQTRVLILSGITYQNMPLLEDYEFLAKPFTPLGLLSKVAQIFTLGLT